MKTLNFADLTGTWCTMDVKRCEAGTQSNESKHSLLPDYIAADNASEDYATMLMLNGAVASNTTSRRKLEQARVDAWRLSPTFK